MPSVVVTWRRVELLNLLSLRHCGNALVWACAVWARTVGLWDALRRCLPSEGGGVSCLGSDVVAVEMTVVAAVTVVTGGRWCLLLSWWLSLMFRAWSVVLLLLWLLLGCRRLSSCRFYCLLLPTAA